MLVLRLLVSAITVYVTVGDPGFRLFGDPECPEGYTLVMGNCIKSKRSLIEIGNGEEAEIEARLFPSFDPPMIESTQEPEVGDFDLMDVIHNFKNNLVKSIMSDIVPMSQWFSPHLTKPIATPSPTRSPSGSPSSDQNRYKNSPLKSVLDGHVNLRKQLPNIASNMPIVSTISQQTHSFPNVLRMATYQSQPMQHFGLSQDDQGPLASLFSGGPLLNAIAEPSTFGLGSLLPMVFNNFRNVAPSIGNVQKQTITKDGNTISIISSTFHDEQDPTDSSSTNSSVANTTQADSKENSEENNENIARDLLCTMEFFKFVCDALKLAEGFKDQNETKEIEKPETSTTTQAPGPQMLAKCKYFDNNGSCIENDNKVELAPTEKPGEKETLKEKVKEQAKSAVKEQEKAKELQRGNDKGTGTVMLV